MLGKPVIRGTRITVEKILSLLAQGQNAEEILINFPHLTKVDIKAAIKYAHKIISEEQVYPLNEELSKLR